MLLIKPQDALYVKYLNQAENTEVDQESNKDVEVLVTES
jgi:hypothetical protein